MSRSPRRGLFIRTIVCAILFFLAGFWLNGLLPGEFAAYESGDDPTIAGNIIVEAVYRVFGAQTSVIVIVGLMFICSALCVFVAVMMIRKRPSKPIMPQPTRPTNSPSDDESYYYNK